jgi:methionine sulfoxide reductase heme-binding subunit
MTMQVPWRDRRGRLIKLKAIVLAAVFIPGLLSAFWWASGQLGGRPVTEVIHDTGLWTIRFLLISLAITPCARIFSWPQLLLVRRMVGVTALVYGVIHLVLYALDQNFALLHVASEIALRFYLTIGFVALVAMGILGATSTDGAMRRMGRNWKRLHRLAYPIAILGTLHYFIQSKANVSEPVFIAGLVLWLMLWRALPHHWQQRWITYPVLAVVAGIGTAWIEFAWYGIATHVSPWRLLAASETLRFGLRPAHYVFLCGVAAAILLGLHKAGPRLRRMRPGPIRSGQAS